MTYNALRWVSWVKWIVRVDLWLCVRSVECELKALIWLPENLWLVSLVTIEYKRYVVNFSDHRFLHHGHQRLLDFH